jgi:hypothetical protein
MAAKTFAEWYSDFISDNRMVPEWKDVKAAINIKEARPTVRAKRPVQPRKAKITPCVHVWGYFHSANEDRCIRCGKVL